MRIAILGTRGIPANYGGFETFAEELGARLASRGHDVVVYGRSHYVPIRTISHRDVRVVVIPTIRHKYLDTVVHALLSTLHSLGRGYDVILMCNAANAIFTFLPRATGTKVVLNVDGIERRRRKWNIFGRAWYRMSERFATWMPDAVVTDARVVQDYYRTRYRFETTFIPYGADLTPVDGTATLARFGLRPKEYFLYVSRLEPENNAHAVIEGFARAGLDKQQLAIVGDAPYAPEYIASLRQAAGPGVTFTGGVYGDGYRELQLHALAYVHATEVGGTHPALVEAMSAGNCVLVNDVAENREAAGDAAWYFQADKPETLARMMRRVVEEPDEAAALAFAAAARARDRFSWGSITDQYERLFVRLLGGGVNTQ